MLLFDPETMIEIAKPNQGVQRWAIECPIFDVMYGGARGGGKSMFLILDWLFHSNKYQGKARGLLIRRTRPQLKDILSKMEPIMRKLGWVFASSEWRWTGLDGSILDMAYLERDADAENYQGWDRSWVGIDEAGNFPDPSPIDKLYATLRLPGVEHKMRLTANPGGPGHQWLRERYVKANLPLQAFKSPQGFKRIYIPARLADNPYTNNEDYRMQLRASGAEWLVQAWLNGDWDIVPGGGVINPDLIIDAKPPELLDRRIIGGDLAFTSDTRNDETAFCELGKWSPGGGQSVQYHITFVDHGHYTISDSTRKIFDLHEGRNIRSFRIEGGPSGKGIEPFVIERMRSEGVLLDFQLVSHMRDKIAKASAFSSAVGMGLVYADKSAPWWPAFRDECMTFDGEDGKSDNMVDAASVAFREIDMLMNNEPKAAAPVAPDPRSLIARDAYIKRVQKGRQGPGPRLMWN